MTSEERHRRMKYGHDIPRWWIPDFHMTHDNTMPTGKRESDKPTKPDKRILKERYELKRRLRLNAQRRSLGSLNKDIRALQQGLAIFFVIIGAIAGGPIGFGLGACIGLALWAIRINL
jgi:hypothetical protein